MDFVVGPPQGSSGYNAASVIVDHLTIFTYFLAYPVDNHVFLKMPPTKGFIRFRIRRMLSSRFINPF